MTKFDYNEYMGDKLSSDECCLSEAEAEAAEAEELERQRIKKACARRMVMLGLVPRSYLTERIVRGK
jgi:hypothetical protein